MAKQNKSNGAAPGRGSAPLPPYSDADLTPLPAAAPPPSERTRARLLGSARAGDAEWAAVLLGAGVEWAAVDR